MAIDRTAYNALVDDDGSNLVGTPWTKAIVASVLLDPIDAAIAAAALPAIVAAGAVLVSGAAPAWSTTPSVTSLGVTGAGTVASPALSLQGGYGFFGGAAASRIGVAFGGVERMRFDASGADYGFALAASSTLMWNSGAFGGGATTADTRLRRTAAGTLTLDDGAGGGGVFQTGNAVLSRLTIAPGTITTSMPISTTQTWNASGVVFEALVVDITKTAAAAASSLLDLRLGGTSQIKLDTNGNLVFATNLAFGTPSRGYFYLSGDGAFNIANNGNTKNATLTASAANELTFTGGTLKLTALALGAIPSTSGDVRGTSTFSVKARNNANTGDVLLLSLGSSDRIFLGGGGNNQINIDPGTSDILWAKPLVAVGPTTLITLGKTGGSGPATAAQNSWLRLLDSTGVPCWIPVWK